MNFYLIQNQPVTWTMPHTSSQKLTFESRYFSGAGFHNSASAETMYQAFQPVFDRKFKQSGQQWPLTLEVINLAAEDTQDSVRPVEGNVASSVPIWTVVVKGDMLKQLHQMLYLGSTIEGLKLQVIVDCRNNYNNDHRTVINTTEFRPQQCAGVPVRSAYEQKNVPIPDAPVEDHGRGLQWRVTIEVVGADYICLHDILPAVSETTRRIYLEKKHCNFEIISEDGTAIPCHKSFLSAGIPDLNPMLEGDFKEATENKMKMEDMSTRGVNALLAFIYCSDAYDAVQSSSVALELLKCADKYDMKDLWKVAVTIVLEKPHEWFEVDVALALFHFIGKCAREESQDVKKGMIKVLAMKRDQFEESALFDEMFTTLVAKEMFLLSLEANKL